MKIQRKRRTSIIGVATLLLCLTAWLSACTAIRPVGKIGVIGSFEGLYRRTGYTALHTTRTAIADASQTEDIIPLALNDLGDPERAARAAAKMSLDGELVAVIGPFLPEMIAGVAQELTADIAWIVPFAVDPNGGFAHPMETSRWLNYLITESVATAEAQGHERLALAGWPEVRTAAAIEEMLPIITISDPDELQPDDVLLWLGDPAGAAKFLNLMREGDHDNPFWLAPWAYDPVFIEHTSSPKNVYWIIWSNVGYNEWARIHPPSTANNYLTYVATSQAVSMALDTPMPKETMWQVILFEIGADGQPNHTERD